MYRAQYEHEYTYLLRQVLATGDEIPDRTGTGTISAIGRNIQIDLRTRKHEDMLSLARFGYPMFPLLTGKRMAWKSIVTELLWFLRGDTNIRYLQENRCTIWDEWADENGDLGPVYGHQWRNGPVDQVAEIVRALSPGGDMFSRRLIVDAWQVTDLAKMRLPPCHMVWQVFVRPVVREPGVFTLDLVTYQRSADLFLGVPFNMASYGLLASLLAHWGTRAHAAAGSPVRFVPNKVHMNFGDAHVYLNHTDAAMRYLEQSTYSPPVIEFPEHRFEELMGLSPSDFLVHDYHHGPSIPAPVAV